MKTKPQTTAKQSQKPAGYKQKNETISLYFSLAGIIALTFIVFSPALNNEFVSWDDYNYIRDNAVIRDLSLKNILHIFHYKTFIMGNYHPLTIISYAIEYKLFGIQPLYYHLNNILLHLANVWLVGYILWLLTRKQTIVIVGTLLFAIHPMRVESVVWAAERKDVLYTLFYLLALLQYIYYSSGEKEKAKHYGYSMFFFLLSILSKGQAVVLPLTFILIDYWRTGEFSIRRLTDKIPFFILSLIFGLLAVTAQSSSLTAQRLVHHTLFKRILYANYNIIAYFIKLIYPYKLACLYGYPPENKMWQVFVSPFIVLSATVYLILRHRNNKPVVFGVLFFLSTIFIVIQLLPIGNAIIADRYTYIPYIGLFFMIALLITGYIEKYPARRKTVNTIFYIQIGVFCIASFNQSQTWRNNETLWNQALKINPLEPIAHSSLGLYYIDLKQYQRGIDHIMKSIENSNAFSEVFKSYNNLGKAYSEMNEHRKALNAFNKALAVAPGFGDALFNRGLTYTDMRLYDSAIADFTYVLNTLQPGHPESYYSRGLAYRNSDRLDSAIADYTRAIKVRPTYSDALTNRGNIYFMRSQYDLAIQDYNLAIKYNPNDANAWLNRSKTYYVKREYTKAFSDAQKVREINPTIEPQYYQMLQQLLSGAPK